MNLPDNKAEKENKESVDFAAILTGREQVPKVYTLDTALATFQSDNNKNDANDKGLNYSVKITDMDQVKDVSIDLGKSSEKEEIVADLYKNDLPSMKLNGKLCDGKITSKKLKGTLRGKNTKELIRKIEKGEAYVNISTKDKPKGKVRGKIKKLS